MTVILKNPVGLTTRCKVGFSWTTLFFGALVPLIRGDLKWFLIAIIVSVLTCGLGWFVFPFVYNKLYLKHLLEIGYAPYSDMDMQILKARGIL